MKDSPNNRRFNIIGYIYSFELLNEELNIKRAFESGDYSEKEIKILEKIIKHYFLLKKMIEKRLVKTWTWSRIEPLQRSILIFGSYELSGNDKALVINEMVEITKEFIPDDTSYKFINSILDSIAKEYSKAV